MYKRFMEEVLDDLAQAYDAGYDEDLYTEDELEAFDPQPPPPGTTLLTRFAPGSPNLTASHRATLARIAADISDSCPQRSDFSNASSSMLRVTKTNWETRPGSGSWAWRGRRPPPSICTGFSIQESPDSLLRVGGRGGSTRPAGVPLSLSVPMSRQRGRR